MSKVFFGLYDFFNLILLITILSFIWRNRKVQNYSKSPTFSFQLKLLPFLFTLIGIGVWLVATLVLEIHILAASALFLYAFGLFGLYSSKQHWKSAIVPFSLVLMTLPFGNIMDVYIGFPLRMLAVDIISSICSSVGISNMSNASIITIENSATQIDFSCSGLKGIWSSLLFFFLLTWLEKLQIGIKWIGTLGLLLCLVFMANLTRILILVLLTSVFSQPELADFIHGPLGIIGFGFACAAVYFIVQSQFYQRALNGKRWILPKMDFRIANYKKQTKSRNYAAKYVLILASFALWSFTSPPVTSVPPPISCHFPDTWNIQKLELSAEETAFFSQQDSSTLKLRFEHNQISGSLLLVKSRGWRGHHNPEYCIRAGGHRIDLLSTVQISPQLPIKWMRVDGEASACYWFQSPSQNTDDFGTRVWSEILKNEKNWVLVSVVFNDAQKIERTGLRALISQLNSIIEKQIN